MTNKIIALIRTVTPIVVGAVASFLLTLGIELDADTQAAFIVALTGVLQAAYYALAQWLSARYKWAGWLLGYNKAPSYSDPITEQEYSALRAHNETFRDESN